MKLPLYLTSYTLLLLKENTSDETMLSPGPRLEGDSWNEHLQIENIVG